MRGAPRGRATSIAQERDRAETGSHQFIDQAAEHRKLWPWQIWYIERPRVHDEPGQDIRCPVEFSVFMLTAHRIPSCLRSEGDEAVESAGCVPSVAVIGERV